MRIILRKIKNKKAFSIAELLVAILILSMVSIVVAGGVPVARDAYSKITVSSNAQVLLSTVVSSLRNELGTASVVYQDLSKDNAIVYRSGKNGNISKIYIGREDVDNLDSPSTILIREYYDPKNDNGPDPRSLVPGTDDLYAIYAKLIPPSENDGIVTVEGLTAKRIGEADKDAPSVDEPITLSIRVFGKIDNYDYANSSGGSGS